MNERTFNQAIDILRKKERLERLEPAHVVDICLDDKSIKSVLDVGTGSGVFAEEFSKHNVKVTGVDLNSDMIEAAKINLPRIDFRIARAEALPFEDKSFDLVFMGLLFHEADDHLKVLQEAKRTAIKEVVILEWYFKDEEFGPPLNHRMSNETIFKIAEEAGLLRKEVIPLINLVLYRFLLS